MPRLASLASAALLLAAVGAHFTLDYPATVGFSDDQEGTAQCGSFSPDFATDNVTNFHVGGDNVAMNLFHPQANWLFRGTLDQTGAGNWTQLFAIVQQTGLGKFCEPAVSFPASWAGQKGLLGVVADGPDGILYQCAALNFVSGVATTTQSACTNGSSVTGSFTSDASLSTLVGSSTSSNTSTGTGSATSSSPTTSSSHSAAPGAVGYSVPLANALVVMAMALMGAAYML